MNRYRNKKTGAVVEVHGTVNGKNWEPVEELYDSDTVEDPYADIFGADPDEEAAQSVPVEAPASKPKAARKGRK